MIFWVTEVGDNNYFSVSGKGKLEKQKIKKTI